MHPIRIFVNGSIFKGQPWSVAHTHQASPQQLFPNVPQRQCVDVLVSGQGAKSTLPMPPERNYLMATPRMHCTGEAAETHEDVDGDAVQRREW